MILENSPNVTYINNEEINKFLEGNNGRQNLESFIHKNGIIEINISNIRDEKLITKKMFNIYKEKEQLYPVTKSGLKIDGESGEIGSMRFCTNSLELAKYIENIIKKSNAFPMNYQGNKYKNVSPYFRFMKYKNGGLHFPHYDSDYEYIEPNNKFLSKYSLVMYLTDNDTGEIAFVNDNRNKEIVEKKLDWDRQASDDEIYLKIKPKKGKIVLFPHDLCHCVLEYKENKERVMIRGDIVFKKGNKNEK